MNVNIIMFNFFVIIVHNFNINLIFLLLIIVIDIFQLCFMKTIKITFVQIVVSQIFTLEINIICFVNLQIIVKSVLNLILIIDNVII